MAWEGFDRFFEFLMDREGRAVTDDPRDPGGQTAWGISRRYHPDAAVWGFVDRGITSGPLFVEAVKAFYKDYLSPYWDHLPPRLREAFCDACVNMGPGRAGDAAKDAVELLQYAMNRLANSNYLQVDGQFGKNTKAAVKSMDASAVAFTMCALRITEYHRRAKVAPNLEWALRGWVNRVNLLMEFI